MNNFHQQNRLSWNEATKRHRSHKPDLIANFQANSRELFPECKPNIAMMFSIVAKKN